MPSKIRRILPYLLAVVAMAGITVAFLPFRQVLAERPASVAFAQVMVTLLAAARWGVAPALVAAGLGLLAFDWYFLPPDHSWSVDRPVDAVMLILFFMTSVAVGHLAAEARRRACEAEAGRRRVEELNADLKKENAERRRTEESLRESESKYRSLMESAPDALVVVDEDGRIRLVNSRAEVVFGYGRSELQGQMVEILVPEFLRQRHIQRRLAYLADPQPRRACSGLQLEGLRKDGSKFPADITLSPTRLRDGLLITAAVRDLSGVKRLEGERASAEAANRAKSHFLANISHELRSPLNTILGFTRLVAQAPELPEAVQEDLELVLKSSEQLHELINDVLDLSKLEIEKVSLEEMDFDLELLVQEVRKSFARKAAEKGLELVSTFHPGTPRHIRGDPAQLRKVLANLVSNAVKFTGAGRVAVDVEAWAADGGPARIEFRVTDTGPGIAPDDIPRLFDPFAWSRSGQESRQGSGLGLALSRGLVQVMGGKLQMESIVGRGTTVRFDIPLQAAAGLAARTEDRTSQVIGLAPGQPRYRILVVDDYPEARQLLVRLLAPLGFEVREAADGQKAVEVSHQWEPDLIWMDMRMPVLDGREAARQIRASQAGRRPVIIALTASSSEGKRSDVLAAGCDDFLRKPFREAKLYALMEKHLGARFVYEAESASATEPDVAALAGLPEDLRRELGRALLVLDTEAVERSIAAIRALDPELGDSLLAWARDFQYERILALLNGQNGNLPASE